MVQTYPIHIQENTMLKKLFSATGALVILAAASFASATTYTFTGPEGLTSLDHYWADSWGINFDLQEGEVITDVTLEVDGIYNWQVEDNDLYISLLDEALYGYSTEWDGQVSGNFWEDDADFMTLLTEYHNLSTRPVDGSYSFSDSEIVLLTDALVDGNFGLGIDADCHFYNDGFSLTITTDTIIPPTNEVPEPATMLLFGAGLAGLAGMRRSREK